MGDVSEYKVWRILRQLNISLTRRCVFRSKKARLSEQIGRPFGVKEPPFRSKPATPWRSGAGQHNGIESRWRWFMPNRRLSLRKIKEILRLKLECGISERDISRSCQVSRSTIADYLRRAAAAKLTWTEVSLLPENQIEERLFPTEHIPSSVKRPTPDCEYIYTQLRTYQKFNLTLSQLWIEYKEIYPDGYQLYPVLWALLALAKKTRLLHAPGAPRRGEIIHRLFRWTVYRRRRHRWINAYQLFVAVWGASNYTFAEATMSQTLPEWISSHNHAFQYFGCVPHLIVPDNLKSGVSKACRYEPDLNPTYRDMAEHYGCAVLPARPRKPRDYPEVLVIPKNLDIVRIFNKPSSNLRDNIYFKPQSFNIMSSLPFHIGDSPSTSFSFGTAFSRAAFNMDISADA